MSWIRWFVFLLVLCVAYLYYIPTPDALEEKFKYRVAVASVRFMGVVMRVHDWLYPGAISHAQFFRSFMRSTLEQGESFAPRVKLRQEVFDGVKVHVYIPPDAADSDLLPGFVYLHGGGMMFGSAVLADGLTRQISQGLNAVVVSIDYRLSPEHKFPVPYEDSLRAAKWFLQHAKQFGVDPDRVAIGGDSAGGFLSATVAQGIHDDAETPNLRLQVLIYPWLQMIDFKTPSYQQNPDGFLTIQQMVQFSTLYIYGEDGNRDIMEAFRTNNHTSREFRNSALVSERLSHSLIPPEFRDASVYIPPIEDAPISEVGEEIWAKSKEVFSDPRSCPLLRKDLSGLPAAYIVTTGVDVLRDDGIMYVKLLERAGVDVTWRHYDNAFHAVLWMGPGISFADGRKMLADMITFVGPRLRA